MKKFLPIALVGAVFVSLWTLDTADARRPVQDPPQESSLEKRVAELENETAELRRENEELRTLVEGTLAYLEDQAKNGQKLLGVLDHSEDLGFTAGINFESREVLLAGFRNYWSGQSKNLPAVKKPKDEQNGNGRVKR